MKLSLKAYHYFLRSLAVLSLTTLAIIPLCYQTSLTSSLLIISLGFLATCSVFIYLDQAIMQVSFRKTSTSKRRLVNKSALSKICFCCR